MNSPYSQKSGTFQIVFTGNEVANGNTFLTVSRRINLSGNYRLRLTGVQGQYSATVQQLNVPPSPWITPNPLLMIVSPQFITNWTPDIEGPIIQWGSVVSNQHIYDPAAFPLDNYIAYNANTFLGQPLSLEYRANLNNLIQLQVRACDLLTLASQTPNGNSVPGQIPFDKTLADSTIFGTTYKTVTFVLTFKFEEDK